MNEKKTKQNKVALLSSPQFLRMYYKIETYLIFNKNRNVKIDLNVHLQSALLKIDSTHKRFHRHQAYIKLQLKTILKFSMFLVITPRGL